MSFGQVIPPDADRLTTVPTYLPSNEILPVPARPIDVFINKSYVVPDTVPFSKWVLPKPGRPYVFNMGSKEIENAIYGDVLFDYLAKMSAYNIALGNQPQKLIKLPNGLEVQSYILQRAIERKMLKILKSQKSIMGQIPKMEQHPLITGLVSLIAGILLGIVVKHSRN